MCWKDSDVFSGTSDADIFLNSTAGSVPIVCCDPVSFWAELGQTEEVP